MASKRATVYFESDVHRAVRMKAAALDTSISEVVNDALRRSLAEDADDLEAFEKRRHEPSLDFETFARSLKRRGKL
jgi:hypothetical protein